MSGHPISPNTTYQELTGRELALNGAVGRARKVVVNGRDYLVAPMTLIVPGVLAGSMGPLYYPPEEIARDYQAWNGMPLVRLHPTRNGSPVSGRQPDVMGTEEMGRVYNARIGSGGRLQAEAWFDVEATRRVDPSILERLAKGDPIELSTGLFTVNHPERGVHNGRPYVAVARDYRPDHLAVLPDRTGACSLRDGCGILINEAHPGGNGMTLTDGANLLDTGLITLTPDDLVDLMPLDGYQPTGDPYLDAVMNCMSPKHPGPCKGWKRGVGATGAASSGAGATTGSGAKPKHPGTGGWTGVSPQRSTTPPPNKPAPAPKPTPPAPKPAPPPPKQVKPAAKKVTKATPPPEPTGHPAIDRARQAATTPAERLKAVYDNAAKYALITTAGRADGAGMSRKHVKEVLDAAKPAEMKGLADALGFRVKPGTSAKRLRKEIEDRIDSRVGASVRSRMLEGPQAESVRANLELSQQGYQTPQAVANEADMNDADLLDAVTNAFCPTGKGGGIKTDCSPKGGAARGGRGGSGVRTGSISTKGTRTSTAKVQTGATGAPKSSPTAKAGGAKVGAAFTNKGEGTRSKGVATKASAAPARKAGEAAAPAKKPARQVKVSRSEMKAAKKLDAARKAALAKGDQETAAKATAKLKRIVERADARAAGSTKVGKGAVGRKLEAKAKEAAMKQAEDKRLVKERKARAKGYKDSNARRKDLIEKREMARVKRADAKANPKKNALAEKDKVAKEQGYKDYKDKNAKGRGFKDAEDRRKHAITVREQARVARADRKAAAKAAATKAEATKTKTEVDKVGREVRSRGRESKAAAKYVKAGVEAAAKGDQKKLSKVVEKVRKLKEKAEKRAARNEETPHELYSFIANELGFVSAADRLKRLAEDTFDLLDYHLVGNVLFTAPNRLAAELHKLMQVANEAQITVNHVQGRAEYEWLLGPVVNRGGRPIEYDGRPIAPTAAERSRLARNAKKRKMQPSDKLKKQGMTPEKACILPGQTLQGRVAAGSEAWYSGQAVRIRTASGECLSVTTNHPVLTEEGFVSAGDIRKGQHLLHHIGEDVPTGTHDHEQYAPALVESVFQALLASAGTEERLGVSGLDFHGDAAFFQGDVRIVRANGPLRHDLVPQATQRLCQADFVGELEHETLLPGGRRPHQVLGTLGSPAPRSVSISDLCLPLFGGHSQPLEPLGFGAVSQHAGFLQQPVHDVPTQPSLLGDAVWGDAAGITVEDQGECGFGHVGAPGVLFHRLGSAAELDVPATKAGTNGRGAGAELFGQLLDRFAGQVAADKVIDVQVFHYEGPVYDFQSPLGYIVTENLVISNCKIMEDGKTNGHWLTKDQKGMFGALCGERKDSDKVNNGAYPAEWDDIDSGVPDVSGGYPAAVANLFAGSGCGCQGGSGLTVNCKGDKMCSGCKAKAAARLQEDERAVVARVQNARRCPYCGVTVKDGEGICPKCGMVMGMAGDGPKTNPAEPYKLMENANPDQARGYRGQWENNDKAAIYHAVRKAFGGNDPAPIPAMSDTPGQAAPTSDPGQDAEAEAAHSVSNMLARVYNSLKKRMGMVGAESEKEEKGEKHKAGAGCGY